MMLHDDLGAMIEPRRQKDVTRNDGFPHAGLRHRNPLRTCRLDRGLSVAELAAVAGLSRAELVLVEDGVRLITRAQQIALAERLGIDPEEIDYAVDHRPG